MSMVVDIQIEKDEIKDEDDQDKSTNILNLEDEIDKSDLNIIIQRDLDNEEQLIRQQNLMEIVREKYYKKRDKKVEILDSDNNLDKEDLIRKYSRNCVFWYFADKYLKLDNPNVAKEIIELAKKIIIEEHSIALAKIEKSFRLDQDLKIKIMSRIEQYKWKDDNYGNSRKKTIKYVEL